MAGKMVRRLHVVPSGSPTATLIRTIAKNQDQPITYPLLLINGEIRHLHHQKKIQKMTYTKETHNED